MGDWEAHFFFRSVLWVAGRRKSVTYFRAYSTGVKEVFCAHWLHKKQFEHCSMTGIGRWSKCCGSLGAKCMWGAKKGKG